MPKFPFTNYHELNLDWILKKVNALFDASEENARTIRTYNSRLTAAEQTATSAATAATSAQQLADAAAANADNALSVAGTADSKAESALTAATDASSAVSGALTIAQEAQQTAGAAVATANDASATALGLESLANTANQNATAAVETAGIANQNATAAQTAANTADQKAVAAQQTANSAQTAANTNAGNISTLQSDVSELNRQISDYVGTETRNIYNPATDEIGSIDSSGRIHPENTDYKHSDFIYVGAGNKVCAKTATSYNGTDGVTMVAYYDDSKNYLIREQVNGTTYAHLMNGAQVYIRIVCNVNTPPFMINLGNALLPYEPYGYAYSSKLDNHIEEIIADIDKLSKSFRWSAREIPSMAEFYNYSGIATTNPTLSELYDLYDNLVTNYPNYVSKKDLGTDQSGTYHIYQYSFVPETVSTGTVPFSLPAKPKVLLGSGTHGNGEAGDKREMVVGLYYFFANLCSNWKENDGLSYLRWNVHFEVIPVQNPWGYANNDRRNSRGVDINRNFPYGWRSGTQGSVDYGGTSALSEAESVIIKNFVEDNTDAIFYYDIHATAGVQEQNKMMYWSMLPNTNICVIANDCIIQLTKKWDSENIGGLTNNVLHGYIDGESASGFGSISQWVTKGANIPAATFEGFPNFKNSTETLDGDTIMRMCLDEIACANLNALRFFKYYM